MKAGAGGVKDLAVDPEKKGANHARIIRSALGLDCVKDEILYNATIPLWDVYKGSRSERPMLVKLPHEAIARDFYNHKTAYLAARADTDNVNVPAFLQHPFVQRHGASECWPIGYYTDKVKLANESFYRGSVKCSLMRTGITVWLLKCSELCRCGCNGLCTLDAIQLIMNSSINSLQRDTFPMSRHDNATWLDSETSSKHRAGKSIGFR